MPAARKTDNVDLDAKLELRSWLLERMEIDRVRVLDTCSGLGHVWRAMASRATIDQWVRCDEKPRQPGVLKITAVESVRRLPLDRFNVIDIDPYGEPWEAYAIALRRLTQPTAIFLTHGHVGHQAVSIATRAAVGLPATWPIPTTPAVSDWLARQRLASTHRHARILHAARMDPTARVTYYALGLAPL